MKFDVIAEVKEIGVVEAFGTKGFQKRNVILSEASGEYENLICIEFSGEKLEAPEQYQVGQMVKVGGFVNCNEWKGKYFTSLRGSFIQSADDAQQQAPQPQQQQAPQQNYQQAPQQPVYQQPQAPQAPQRPQAPQAIDPSMAPPRPSQGQVPF
tara:strand:- start:316 stop:774 length:459 start_codon:yes stop_codon:yes gene_type:complete